MTILRGRSGIEKQSVSVYAHQLSLQLFLQLEPTLEILKFHIKDPDFLGKKNLMW